MKAAEKLLQDIAYWQEQEREAREALRIAETVLPGLRRSLQDLQEEEVMEASVGEVEAAVDATERAAARGAEAKWPDEFRLRGHCEDQVEQALAAKHPQSPEDLVEFLRDHGRAYSRGAINYAIRALRDRGKIREVEKRGNLRYYELAEPEG